MSSKIVSIIVSCKNEGKQIERLLKSLRLQTYKPIEIIIVDNFSTDNTVPLAQKYTKKIFFHGPERSPQRNYGVLRARGRFVLFLDADMELSPEVIADCVGIIQKERAVGVIIPETVHGKGFFVQIKNLEKKLYLGEETIEAARFFLKAVLVKVGGYNEKLIAGEDWDLTNRIRSLGKISRVTVPLLHYETSFIREVKHKVYYATKIADYASLYPKTFTLQSGRARLALILRKKKLLQSYPLETCGLIALKGFEYILYRLVALTS